MTALRLYRIDDGEVHWYAAETEGQARELHREWMEPEQVEDEWSVRELGPAELLTVQMDNSSEGYPAGAVPSRLKSSPPYLVFTATAEAWAEWAGRPTQVSSTCF